MADILVTCPTCNGQITCDNAWAGQEVNCPLCDKPLTVPARPGVGGAPRHNPLVPVPPAGPGKLALGNQPAAATPGKNIPIRSMVEKPRAKKSPLATILPVAGIVALLGAAGFFGWPYFKEWREKKSEGDAAKAAADAAAAAAATNTPPPPKLAVTLPAVPATWTLDSAAAKFTDGRASGMLSGTNFLVDTVRVDSGGTDTQVLLFIQGEPTSPDREIMVYVRLSPGENIPGQNITISKDTRGSAVQMVAKRWKSDPRYAPKLQSYAAGYVLKLELGAEANGNIPGRVFLALPDKEKSVLAGKFDLSVASAAAGLGVPGAMNPAQMEMMRKRGMMRPPGR